jgi:hypothetical protein
MPRRVANLSQRPTTRERVTNKGVPPVVYGQSIETLGAEYLARSEVHKKCFQGHYLTTLDAPLQCFVEQWECAEASQDGEHCSDEDELMVCRKVYRTIARFARSVSL